MSSIPFVFCSSIALRDDYMFTIHDNLYILLKGKEQMLNDVVDMLIFITCDRLLYKSQYLQ